LLAASHAEAVIQIGGKIMTMYCPDCRHEIQCVGINGCGKIYVCGHCNIERVIGKKEDVSIRFHKTGAVSIDWIRYGPSTEIARFFVELRATEEKENRKALDIHDYGKLFPNDTIVTHIRGGRGKIKTLENDWSTDPPTVIALVEVLDTMFPGIRKIPVTELTKIGDKDEQRAKTETRGGT
jgi:hypothetical protein